MPAEPAPINVGASGKFLGNDGAWSTFAVDVGTPAQTVQLLVSTQQSANWAVAASGCGDDGEPKNCSDARGGLFDSAKSSTWFRKDVYALNEAINLGWGGDAQNGTYGFDTLTLSAPDGGPKVTADHQVVAGMATPKFYLGSIGLAPQTVNFSNSQDSSPSFISSLKEMNQIPSLSYGYTAGGYYKERGGDASLVLGGYDSAKFERNDLELDFGSNAAAPLQAGLQAITYTDSGGDKNLLSEGTIALIDSTVPYLWLPKKTCDAFADAFGLEWDNLQNLFTVNNSAHKNNVKTNPMLTFAIASPSSSGKSVNIKFPYAAFDLNATAPLVKQETRYFPLQRAPDDNSITLGRTFLQEAYLITNYETSTFSVSQATSNDAPSQIVTIHSNANGTSSGPSGSASKSHKSGGFGTGAIAGVAIAIALVGIIVAVVFFCLRRRRRERRNAANVHQHHIPPSEMTKTVLSTARTSTDDPEPKKLPDANVSVQPTEAPMTPPPIEMDGNGRAVMDPGPSSQQQILELPGDRYSRSELSTPDPTSRPELSSPGLAAIRSELSTPEPIFAQQELPTPDPSYELPSPSMFPADRPSPQMRPSSMRLDSSESESGFTHDGMKKFGHRRYLSDKSPRPTSIRQDTDDSIESPVLPHLSTNFTDLASPTFTASPTADSPVATTGRQLGSVAKRPVHFRQDSDTWQTRLTMASDTSEAGPPSRFNTVKEPERKESGASEVSSLGDSPLVRKPVPIRGASDGQNPLVEEGENDKDESKKKEEKAE